jgi:carnitine 3-dehydrogenase
LRWSLLGPFMNLHLSGGAGGVGALFGKPLWQATEGMWRDLGSVTVDADLGARVVPA